MTQRFDGVWQKFEQQLIDLENRFVVPLLRTDERPVVAAQTQLEIAQMKFSLNEQGDARRAMASQLARQRTEIAALRRQLKDARTDIETREREFRQQQVNVSHLVEQWEKRFAAAEEEKAALALAAAKRQEVSDEASFLKNEVESQRQHMAQLEEKNRSLQQSLRDRDAEVARLFARVRLVEEDRQQSGHDLDVARAELRLSSHTSGHRHHHRRRSPIKRFMSWLNRPMIVIETE